MRSLTEEQVDFIADDIRLRGVFTQSLQEDLLDHICCFIEEQPDDERPFGEVYRQALEAFGQSGLQAVQDETLFLINQPYQNAMKKFAYITGAIASVSLVAGALFKISHWPGANLLLLLGTLVLAMFFVPYFFYVQMREQTEKKNKVIAALGLATALFLCAGALFKLMHWPGAIVMIVGFGIFFVIFLPLYVINGVRNPLTKVSSISNGFLFAAIGGFVMLLSFQQPSRSVTESMSVIEQNESALLNELKSDTVGISPAAQSALTQFVQSCDEAVNALSQNGGTATIGNGAPVGEEQLVAFNDNIETAVIRLNGAMNSNPHWTPLVFEKITPTLYGSVKFQVIQLETRAYVNAR